MELRKYAGAINKWMYIGIWGLFTLIIYFTMYRKIIFCLNSQKFMNVQFCTSDMMNICFKNVRLFLMIFFIILIIYKLKSFFRNIVILQFKNRQNFYYAMNKIVIANALVFSICATTISLILGLILADSYSCNWLETNSYMYALYGVPTNPHIISTIYIILIFEITIFFTLLIIGMLLLSSWYLKNPIIGVFGVFIIYGFEIATKPPILKVFFNYIELDTLNIYFYGINYIYLIFYTLMLYLILNIFNILIIRKKNIL